MDWNKSKNIILVILLTSLETLNTYPLSSATA